jgi:bacterioferritin
MGGWLGGRCEAQNHSPAGPLGPRETENQSQRAPRPPPPPAERTLCGAGVGRHSEAMEGHPGIDEQAVTNLLRSIVEFELAGVVRYTHYSLMVSGPYRLPIVQFMRGQATESLAHALRAGEILTGLGGHPSMKVAAVEESGEHGVRAILEESLVHERRAVDLYRNLLSVVQNRSVFLEEYARSQIAVEEEHLFELRKMLRDFE